MERDEKKQRRDSIGRMSENDKKGDKDEKKEKNAETTEQRRSRRAAAPTTSSSSSNNEPEVKSKEKKSTSALMSEDIFDMEVAKAKGEKLLGLEKKENASSSRKTSESKKRSSVVDSDDEATKQPVKKARPEMGPLSPNSRRMSTSFEKRQSQRRKSRDNLTKMKMPNATPATSLATAANSMEQ